MAFKSVEDDFNRSASGYRAGTSPTEAYGGGPGEPDYSKMTPQEVAFYRIHDRLPGPKNTGSSGGKKSPAPAPQVIRLGQRNQQPSIQYVQQPYTQQAAPQIDYAGQLKSQERALQQRRESDLRNQATDIVNERLASSRTAANLYGTRSASTSKDEFNNLVTQEFSRLLTMDQGNPVENLAEAGKMRKYEGLRRGRGWRPSEPLSEQGLLG